MKEGDRVVPGQIVAWIAPLPMDSAGRDVAGARLRSAEAFLREANVRVDQSRVALEQSQNTERRQKALLDAGAISPQQHEDALADSRVKAQELMAAQSRVRAASADVAAAKAVLIPVGKESVHAMPVRSPVSGRVLRVPEASERVVTASAPIIELGDASTLEVISDVLSSDAVRIHAGDEALIDEWGGDHPLTGRVRLIEPSAFTRVSALGVDEQRVNVIVDILNPPASLGDGFQVEVKTVVWSSPDVLTVPSSSVFQRSGAWAVFVVEDGHARLRKVVVGHKTGASAEIVEGVKAGEKVIMFPSDKIDNGTRVR
jgi:HlyD family secretion protein